MGVCCCKPKNEEQDSYTQQIAPIPNVTVHTTVLRPPPSFQCIYKPPDPDYVDRLVLETLGVIATLVDK